jgi:hypothetical protein
MAQYEYDWTEAFLQPRDASNETGRVVVKARLGYALTERLAVGASAAYVGITNYKPTAQNLPAPNWATFGAKLTYVLIGPFRRRCVPLDSNGTIIQTHDNFYICVLENRKT